MKIESFDFFEESKEMFLKLKIWEAVPKKYFSDFILTFRTKVNISKWIPVSVGMTGHN